MQFNDFNIDARIKNAIEKMGFENPTPIQEMVIPVALEGTDIIAGSKTGTGKTVGFGVPIIEKIDFSVDKIQALILTPTRELAMQVNEEINRLLRFYQNNSVALYGGENIDAQIKRLKARPQIIVATPGRLMDHMRRKTVRTENINMVVLDEADEMLSMGFDEDVKEILSHITDDRQIMLFSATITPRVQNISENFMKNPQHFKVQSETKTVDKIEQYYFEVEEGEKLSLLYKILDMGNIESCIIFGKTKRRVDELIEALKASGYKADGIHGDLRQDKREKILKKFRNKMFEIFVATDVAARGLDIDGISHVINFDLPQDTDIYVHRIGRTGRAGKTGVSYTFAQKNEKFFINLIEQQTKSKLKKLDIPSNKEINDKILLENIRLLLEKSEYIEVTDEEKDIIENHLDKNSIEKILIAALREISKDKRKYPTISLTKEKMLQRTKKMSQYEKHNSKNNNRNNSKKTGNKNRVNNKNNANNKDFDSTKRGNHNYKKNRRGKNQNLTPQ